MGMSDAAIIQYTAYMDGLSGEPDREAEEAPEYRPYYRAAYATGKARRNLNRADLLLARAELTPVKARILDILHRADPHGLTVEAITERMDGYEADVRIALADLYDVYVTRVDQHWHLLNLS